MGNRGANSPIPPSPLSPESAGHIGGWRTIGEQQDFYDEQDCLYPSHNLASEKLRTRKEDDVVIFDYSLDPDYLSRVGGNPLVEEDSPLSEGFDAEHDMFFQVPKNQLIRSEQFDQIINPTKEPQEIPPRGSRLGIIRFGTGVSLRAPSKKPSELSGPGPSEDRFVLFVSFPYFGGSSKKITLDPESESVKLLDFKRLGVGAPGRGAVVSEEERDDVGEILVHQARYMIFDNYTMATFRSKEDSAKDEVPLHHFQERIGAFRSMIHMIANRMELELWTLGKLQASLYNLEENIDQMISDQKAHDHGQGMARIPDDARPKWAALTKEGPSDFDEHYERVRKNNDWKKKQMRVQFLLASLNGLSAALFATINVAERQFAVLQDLHSVFLTSYRTKTKDGEKGYPLRRNPFFKNPNTLDTIDEVVREKESFIKKIKGLVENMEVRREILFGFLRSEQAKAAPYERTAQESRDAIKSIEDTIKGIWVIHAQQVQLTKTLSVFTLATTAVCWGNATLSDTHLLGAPEMRDLEPSLEKLVRYGGIRVSGVEIRSSRRSTPTVTANDSSRTSSVFREYSTMNAIKHLTVKLYSVVERAAAAAVTIWTWGGWGSWGVDKKPNRQALSMGYSQRREHHD
ncbi:hypothetical protein B9Z19DRAFT_1124564 [Tuber borchii]|uniref:Uncharacterized protein n=1 Tax=Tuber borchii TaxID=42251 RepID=A0A2T6ZWJ9_TUBBO|nr:hypothetical protein B9Z19DRAFT_1124564 [Tuber borchii]